MSIRFFLFSEVMVCWIVILSIVIFLIEIGNNGLGGSNEVFLIDCVRNVSVKVILEVLKHVHVVNYGIVSSNSWERESIIVKLPGMNLWDFSSEFTSNLDSVIQILDIEMSRELINLPS